MPNARVDAAVRVFFADAINTYISRLSKADRPPQRGWAACDPQRTEKSEVPRGRGDSARSRRGSRPTRSIAPSWVCGLSSASPADFALARPHMCTSQFLRTFLSLSLCIYTSMQTTHWLFLWRTLLPNLPTQGIPSLLGKLASKRNFRSQTRQNGSKCQRLVGAIPQSAHPEAYKADTSGPLLSRGGGCGERQLCTIPAQALGRSPAGAGGSFSCITS